MMKIAPSILSADFSKLGEEIKNVDKAGADIIHIDVMDGVFVPNITIGPLVVKSIRNITRLEFDVHLMINNPDPYIDEFVNAGADIICVHAEACKHLHRTVQKIKERNVKAAVSINPATPINNLEYILNELDMVLLMTVNPGFGGQSYIDCVTEKIETIRNMSLKKGVNLDIEVDGGIDENTIKKAAKAGANVFVSGTTIFRSENMKETIKRLRDIAQENSVTKR